MSIFDKIDKVVDRYNEIEQQMADPDVLADHVRVTELAQERTEMGDLVETYRAYRQRDEQLAQARELAAAEEDEEMAALAAEEVEGLSAELEQLTARLRSLLIPLSLIHI